MKKNKFKKISILIPTYNGGAKALRVIKLCKKLKFAGLTKEIVVVDDCSPDRSYLKLKTIRGIKFKKHRKNIGKGGAVASLLKTATGDILVIQDDDEEYNPNDIKKLIKPILLGKADAAFGSRQMNKNNYSYLSYFFGGIVVNKIISIMLRYKISDPITGHKAFTREVYNKIKPIESKSFEIETELSAKIVLNKFKLVDVAISYKPRSIEEGKAIRWHHALPILRDLFKYVFTYRPK